MTEAATATTPEPVKSTILPPAPTVSAPVDLVPMKSITVREEDNARTDYEGIEDLAALMKQYGQLNPVILHQQGDQLVLVAGFRRFKAATLNKQKHIRATILPFSGDVHVIATNLIENIARSELHDADLAAGLVKLQEHGLSKEDVAKQVGLSKAHTNNLIRARRQLIPAAIRAWRKYEGSTKFMFALAAMEEEEQKDELEKWIASKTSEGKTPKTKKKGAGSEDGEEGEKATAKDIRDMLEVLTGDLESSKIGTKERAFLDGKLLALGFVKGEISKRKMQQSVYKP